MIRPMAQTIYPISSIASSFLIPFEVCVYIYIYVLIVSNGNWTIFSLKYWLCLLDNGITKKKKAQSKKLMWPKNSKISDSLSVLTCVHFYSNKELGPSTQINGESKYTTNLEWKPFLLKEGKITTWSTGFQLRLH